MKADKKLKLRGKKKRILEKIEYSEQVDETKLQKSSKSKTARYAARIFLIFVLSLILLFLIFNINYLTPSKMKEHMSAVFADMGSGEGYPYHFSSDDIVNFFSFNTKDKVILTNKDLIILNSSANPVLNYKHSMSNPIAQYSKDRILLFDQGSTKAVMLNQSGQLLEFPNDDKIICGDVSDSGKSVIVSRNEKNKEQVSVYSFSGKKIMSWNKGSGYIVDAAVSPNGNLLTVGIIDTEDAVETINVFTFTLSNAKQKGHTQFKASSLYDIVYLDSNDLCVLCNDKISVLNSKCETKAAADLPSVNNQQLYCDKFGHIVNVYSLYNNGKYVVDIFNSDLKKIYSKECEKDIVKVNTDSNTLAVLYTDKTADVNMIRGKVTYRAKFNIDPFFIVCKSKQVFGCSNGMVEKVKALKQ